MSLLSQIANMPLNANPVGSYLKGDQVQRQNRLADLQIQGEELSNQLAQHKLDNPILFNPVNRKIFDPKMFKKGDEIVWGAPVINPQTGQAEYSMIPTPDGMTAVKETPAQKRQNDLLFEMRKQQQILEEQLKMKPQIAGAETTAKSKSQRQEDWINEGLAAADSYPTIMRGIELLESGVNTGGFDKLKLWATDTLGITGGDEGELSANLGKAVLSQLRTTFGAQFTEREGARLERIEAGFGKSAQVNLRLLQQIEKTVKRAANRGIRAAESSGDKVAANEIRNALKFTFSDKSDGLSNAEQDELIKLRQELLSQ